ncbi:TPA: toxin ArtA [Escherichia coli]|uniref:toxin ArtA n=1 Tax=Escherichia coli TaxID=562 RepID=UPI001650094A|nr:toxin ArtA [Escherichia coli]EFH7230046.1 toxin ArtA [Escherichia coli]EFO2159392.1 toxin ArtA [Escherichia coli]EFO3303342.1 toxin ArtA [Escherichia coli]EFU6096722.1 toxin ArtA [Escherichia coli]
MEKRSFKEKLEIIRNIIRESLLGNAAIIALIYAASHSLPVNAFPDYLVISLLSIAAGIVIYIYFCELFRSHWIAVWFIIWSSVINLIILYGFYDRFI